ncbi:uncharacterized protein LOC133333314 [Musca vetustissima]|uniref:uncharacterized protein LOC133333314 n=1 Tax=Musca vetustissima TaxID=27455 RepID=UPI002AB6D5F4|nr:uncharacterized protein LOC133333314 [Musca vetustissima]
MREPFRNYRIIFNILLILEIKLGIAIITVTAAYQHVLNLFMLPQERRLLTSTFINLYIMGFQLIATYLCSFSMWRNIWARKYSRSIQLLVIVWSVFCFIIVVGGCATIWHLLNTPQFLIANVSMMLFRGIEVYYSNPSWKFFWDELQYTNECCGVNGYDDWMHASWMPQSYVKESRQTRTQYRPRFKHNPKEHRVITNCIQKVPQVTTDISIAFVNPSDASLNNDDIGSQILAPYACCKYNSLSCYQNYLPRTGDGVGSISQLNITEINTKACLPLFKEYLLCAVNVLLILVSLAVLIDILMCCLTKYLMLHSRVPSYCELDPSYDDDGNALVVVKCPPRVRCVTLEESDSIDSDVANIGSDVEPCICTFDMDMGVDCSNVGQYPINHNP